MIWAARFLASASMDDLSRWIVGFSHCKSKFKLVKIDMAHWLNRKASSKSGFESQSFKHHLDSNHHYDHSNCSSLKSSLNKI